MIKLGLLANDIMNSKPPLEKTSFSEKYTTFVQEFLNNPSVSQSKKSGFGSGLRVNGKVFAMPAKGQLVVKLPVERIQELTQSSEGKPYEYGGKMAKGWFVVSSEDKWHVYTQEALEYISEETSK